MSCYLHSSSLENSKTLRLPCTSSSRFENLVGPFEVLEQVEMLMVVKVVETVKIVAMIKES